jgi:hypothetical protein
MPSPSQSQRLLLGFMGSPVTSTLSAVAWSQPWKPTTTR